MAYCSPEDGHDHLVNLLLIGDSGVGKSSLLSRFTRGKFRPDPKPTTTNNIVARHVYVDDKVIKAQIVDIGGNTSYSDISTELLSANGALIVYDVTSFSTYEAAEKWYRELRIANGKIEVMLIGNKSDLMIESVTTTAIAGKEFAMKELLGFTETSSMDNINVEKAFVEVVTWILQKLIKNDTMYDGFNSNISSTIYSEARMSRYSGKNEPAHYMLKIESFSLLCKAKTNKFESDVFEAGGYKWKLELYPNGNEESGGNICEAESLPKGWQILVDSKFCVYDHMQHNYITFQDVEGEMTRIHEKNTKWGFSKLISLASFTDVGNGFLYLDSCVFGAEVFVVPKYAQIDQCLSMIKPPADINTHTWTIDNFSAITNDVVYSDEFKIGKVMWNLALHPKGEGEGTCTNLYIFLQLPKDSVSLSDSWCVYTKSKIRVKNQGGHADQEEEDDMWFNESDKSCGYESFMLLSEVNDPEEGFLLHDMLEIIKELASW